MPRPTEQLLHIAFISEQDFDFIFSNLLAATFALIDLGPVHNYFSGQLTPLEF